MVSVKVFSWGISVLVVDFDAKVLYNLNVSIDLSLFGHTCTLTG